MLGACLDNVRERKPLIHNITNYVTINDCANIILACGGSPIMADDLNEVNEITTICNGLNINIGTLNERTIESMILAGKQANALGHPVIFDPVGVGASLFRTQTARQLMKEIHFAVIRGNISEIKTLAMGTNSTRGVDADVIDQITVENFADVISFARNFSKKMQAVIAITGAIDIVTNEKQTYVIRNGVPMMSEITGSGCMLTAMTAAYIAANQEEILKSVVASICAMGYCGERAYEKVVAHDGGNASFRNFLIDEVYKLDGQKLEVGAKYEIYQ